MIPLPYQPTKKLNQVVVLLALAICCLAPAKAVIEPSPAPDWPGWRNDGSGVYHDLGQEVHGDSLSTQSCWRILWEASVPGRGVSSPIVSNGRVFVTAAHISESRKHVMAIVWAVLGCGCAIAVLLAFRVGRNLWQVEGVPRRFLHLLPVASGALLFPATLLISEYLCNSGTSTAQSLVAVSLSRIWVVSSATATLAVLLAMWTLPPTQINFLFLSPPTLFLVLLLCLTNPDPANWTTVPHHFVELTLGGLGGLLGLLSRFRKARLPAMLLSLLFCLVIVLVALHWHRTMDYGFAHLRQRLASGLLAAVGLGGWLTWLSRARSAPISMPAKPPTQRALPLLLILLGAIHLWGANRLVPSLGLNRNVICHALESGDFLWAQSFPTPELERIVPSTSYATPTPASDGSNVVAYFGPAGLHAFDHQGRKKWMHPLGPFKTEYGAATSPVVANGLVMVVSDSLAGSYVIAVDMETGRTRWQKARGIALDSYGTPFCMQGSGQITPALLVAGAGTLAAYDIATGTELWIRSLGRKTNHAEAIVIQSPVVHGPAALIGGEHRGQRLFALAIADAPAAHPGQELWQSRKPVLGYASPLAISNLIFTVDNLGIASCLSLADGRILWQERLQGPFSASPAFFEGRVILVSENGIVTELAPIDRFTLLGQFVTGHSIVGSPAFHRGKIILRTLKGLACYSRCSLPASGTKLGPE